VNETRQQGCPGDDQFDLNAPMPTLFPKKP
jgi:hypothetical protein